MHPRELLPRPTAGAAPPLFILEGISLDCKYFNSQKLEKGWGGGWGGSWLAVPLHSGLLQPHKWQQHSKTCSGVLVPYTQHKLDIAGNTATLVGTLLAPPNLSQSRAELVPSQGPHSHRVEERQMLGPFDG
jgi:hypothetical protein